MKANTVDTTAKKPGMMKFILAGFVAGAFPVAGFLTGSTLALFACLIVGLMLAVNILRPTAKTLRTKQTAPLFKIPAKPLKYPLFSENCLLKPGQFRSYRSIFSDYDDIGRNWD